MAQKVARAVTERRRPVDGVFAAVPESEVGGGSGVEKTILIMDFEGICGSCEV